MISTTKTTGLLALALAACGAAIDPGVRTTVPHPEVAGADHGEETFAGEGGVMLYGQWRRPKGDVRAVLVVQHGLNDHGDRYAHLAQVLVARGYAVYALDLPGHGRSAGPRTTIDRFDDYVRDEEAWLARVRAHEAGAPIFVFGHSMGGLIMTLVAEEHPDQVAGVVLSAPALGVDAPALQLAAIQLAAHLGAPGHMLPQHDPDFSRDPAVVADMGRDPLLPHGDGPTHTAVELVEAIRVAWAGADRLTAPLVVFHGTGDQLTSPAATRDFVARAASADKRHVVIADAWHDLAHDPARDTFEQGIAAWLDAHTGGPALPPPAPAPARLPGDHAPSATAVEVGGVLASSLVDTRSKLGASFGALDLRASRGGRAIAWHGELAVRVRDGAGVDVLPLGVAHRLGRAGEVSLATGVGAGWPGAWGDLSLPVRLGVELPVGPVHLLARVTASLRLRGYPDTTRTLAGDGVGATLALRLGGERDYWSQVSAGAGPFVGVSYSESSGAQVWALVIGLHLWGVD